MQWPAVEYETLPWTRDDEDMLLIPRSARRKIAATYEASIPPRIGNGDPAVASSVLERASAAESALARFDERQRNLGYQMPALLLRSESSASSQIENLTSSVRNVALAEVSGDAPRNARIIAGNVAAMRTALALDASVDARGIKAVHRALMLPTGADYAGEFRTEQVWVGGTPYSPHGALFVPPKAERIDACIEDLTLFCARDDIDPIVQAAVAHAQFETIHPFVDGNGRTGRALLHKQLACTGVLAYATLPISSGLLNDVSAYMGALDAYHDGRIAPIVEAICNALETALVLGQRATTRIDEVLEGWNDAITERKGSAMHRLPPLLVEQPVVSASFVSRKLGITDRAARSLLDRACNLGMLRPLGDRHRGRLFQADELIGVLEDLANAPGIRRMLAR